MLHIDTVIGKLMYFITLVKCTYMNKKNMQICVKWTFCYTNYKSMCKSCDTCRINIVTKTGCAISWLYLIVKYVVFSALTRTMWKANKYDGMFIFIRFFLSLRCVYTRLLYCLPYRWEKVISPTHQSWSCISTGSAISTSLLGKAGNFCSCQGNPDPAVYTVCEWNRTLKPRPSIKYLGYCWKWYRFI